MSRAVTTPRGAAALLAEPRGHRLGVLGLGQSGTAMALHLVRRGAQVVGADLRREGLDPRLAAAGVELRLGPTGAETFADVEGLAVTPGADPRQPAVAALRAAGKPVFGELELVGALPQRVVCITGTNGKSTTTALCGALVQGAGRPAFVGGNLGEPVLTWLDRGDPADAAVIELSSYQLETAERFRTDVAVVLNVTPDHFERYASMTDYAAAKARLVTLLRDGGVAILNHDDPIVRAMARSAAGRVWWFSTRAAEVPGDGAVLADDRLRACGALAPLDGLPLDHPRLLGRHNRENALAALLAAFATGLVPDPPRPLLEQAYRAFVGLEHRLEWVGEHRGVLFINDSKATNDDAAAIAVAAMQRPVVLLAGGRDKGTGYAALVAAVSRQTMRAIIACGEAEPLIAAALAGHPALTSAPTLRAAFREAIRLAQPGDVVLLAPACSSFDEFANYKERGREFKAWVRAFAEGR